MTDSILVMAFLLGVCASMLGYIFSHKNLWFLLFWLCMVGFIVEMARVVLRS